MPYTTLYFDLDDTLYNNASGLWQMIRGRMGDYMSARLGLPPEDVPALRRRYFETYGTTLRGLQHHHAVDADDYLAYVHDVPLEAHLTPNPVLRRLLLSLSLPRWIFTNADSDHAGRVLRILGLEGCFEGVIDIRALEFLCKPEEAAYRRALALSGDPRPQECIFFDDSLANLAGAHRLGMTTVLVGPHPGPENGSTTPTPDYVIPDLLALPACLPQLWPDGAPHLDEEPE